MVNKMSIELIPSMFSQTQKANDNDSNATPNQSCGWNRVSNHVRLD